MVFSRKQKVLLVATLGAVLFYRRNRIQKRPRQHWVDPYLLKRPVFGNWASMMIENSEKLEQDGLQSNNGQDIKQVDEKVAASPEQIIKQENSLEINSVAEEFSYNDIFKPFEESAAVTEEGVSSAKKESSNEIGCAIAEQVSSEDMVKCAEGSVVVTEEGPAAVDNGEKAVEFEEKKLFVASLSVHTTRESLKCFYAQFGEVVDCHVATDKMTGMTRCFGFVTFSSSEAIDKAMNSLPHEIDGRQADVKRAVPFRPKVAPIDRLFLGGLRPEHSKEVLSEYFSKYGTVTKVDLAMNSATGQSRGFGFIFFESSDAAEECLKNPTHMVAGAECRVKKAVEKQQMGRVFQGRNFYGQNQNIRGGYGTPGYRPSPRGGWNSGGRMAGPYGNRQGRHSFPGNFQGWPAGDPVSFFGTGYNSPVGWGNRFVQGPQMQRNPGWGNISPAPQPPPVPLLYMDFQSDDPGQARTIGPTGGV